MNRNTPAWQTSMHRPQLVQFAAVTTGVPAPFSAGLMTWTSGQTLKQSPQSSHAPRRAAATRTTEAFPIRL